ncbi:MAG: alpha-amylase family glycosyl hydrolase, partial [Terriglobia bacterium]
LRQWASMLRAQSQPAEQTPAQVLDDPELWTLALGYPDRRGAATYEKSLDVVVDREKARFSSWYEMFPRSWAREPGQHGTLGDCEAALPYIAAMGFDVLYLPPIHPIGRTSRKGKNNQPSITLDDVGSPWAIGAVEGGHKSVHPQLGTVDDFDRLFERAREHSLEIALDLAYQCSPDHPYVESHADWFLHRPDGSIQYAENPPKKYEDIYPLDFECKDWQALWEELKSIVLFWIEHGVRIFRVDNPHTKPFAFWEWLIDGVKDEYPDVIFLAEAFTRPQVMQRLAKLGFSQSYTYFAWRNTKAELTEYFTELTQTEAREYFRPSLWPNTPDILTESLQSGGRAAFISRLVLAATLGASYGIYGPAFELCENRALVPGKEEYLDAEKYQLREWDLDWPGSIKEMVALVNRARRGNPALQSNAGLRFHRLDNDQLIAYSKANGDQSNVLLMVVNLDPRSTQSGWVEIPLEEFGIPSQAYF